MEKEATRLFSFFRVFVLVFVLVGLATIVRLNYVGGVRSQETRREIKQKQPELPVVLKTQEQLPSLAVSRRAEIEPEQPGATAKEKAFEKTRIDRNRDVVRVNNQTSLNKVSRLSDKINGTYNQGKIQGRGSAAAASAAMVHANVSAIMEKPGESETAVEISLEPPDKTLDQKTALLTLNSYARARIYIDGQYSGTTPRTVRLLSGEHHIVLIADGYEEWTRRIRLNGRQQTGMMASMSKKDGTLKAADQPDR